MSLQSGTPSGFIDIVKSPVRRLTAASGRSLLPENWDVSMSLVGRMLRGALAILAGGLAVGASAADHALLGRVAPEFALRATSGANIRLSEHRGEVVVITFWGSRCNTCRPQLATFNRIFATYRPAGLLVLGVNVDDDQEDALAFARSQTVDFPMLLDPAKGVSREYRVDNLPMALILDRGGAVRYVHRDFKPRHEADYTRELRELLNE
jgi:peroxiredoxin